MRSVGAAIALLLVVALALVPAPATGGVDGARNPCVGTISEPAEGTTVISVQGARIGRQYAEKKPARVVGVGPTGEIEWVHQSTRDLGVAWSYDVDPLPGGNLFVTATRPGRTFLYEFDPRTGETAWNETLDMIDTHDADILGPDRILIANMRNYDEEAGTNDDRILVYDRTADEVVWEWRFRDHGFSPTGGDNYSEDWTHVNDVDRVREGEYLVSVRNFDQVVLVNRSTDGIDLRLGADDDRDILFQQHNPQYLESEAGRPTILVADSENDRVVEYERRGGGWERTWSVGGPESLSWPRDADRLPNGNTLIVDSTGHRVIEVTPSGDVVWEFYAPWLVYDAERLPYGDEAGGPTIRDLGAEGEYDLSGATSRSDRDLEACAATLRAVGNGTATPTPPTTTSTPTRSASPASPLPGSPSPTGTAVSPLGLGAVALLAVAVLLAAVWRYRR